MIDFIMQNILMIVVLVIVFIVLMVLLSSMVHASPDVAKVVSGIGKQRYVIGRSGLRIPIVERVDWLVLRPIKVDVKTDPNNPIPTVDFVGVNVDSNFFVQVDDENLATASKNFLNMSEEEIAQKIQDALQGNLREIVGQSTLEELSKDRKALGDRVQTTATPDMHQLGLKIISSNIQSLTDVKGLINDLGEENSSRIKKNALVAKAMAERDIQIAQAASQEESNKAVANSQLKIAQQNINKDREIAIQQTAFEKEKLALEEERKIAQAKTDAVYEIEQTKHKKSLVIEEQAARLEEANRQSELNEKNILLKEQELDATIKKQADADLYKRQKEAEAELIEKRNEAEARKAQAEAEYVEAQRKADADNYEQLKKAEAIKKIGEAEAEATRQKGIAEAEAITKIAEAKKQYGELQMQEKMIETQQKLIDKLPEIAAAISKSVSQIQGMTVYGGTGEVTNMVPTIMKQVFDTTKSATGIDMTDIMMSNSKTASTDKNIEVKMIKD